MSPLKPPSMTNSGGLEMVPLCALCRSGAGGECHTPGCALWMNRAPDVPVQPQATAAILEQVRDAAREVDRHFDPNDRGPLPRPGGEDEWIFGGKRVSAEASIALLILHDCLNDAAHPEEARDA